MVQIRLKRAYDPPAAGDGRRVLVDRIWPRGVSKKDLALDDWCKDLAPSTELRHWFDHDADRWDEFKKRYAKELDARPEAFDALCDHVRAGRVTLVFAAKDVEHNNAVALKELITERLA
ncbi:MAG: DUF488 family protein [Geminicoccaceae bacterium]|nr:DUF488 family protein [Geminicoccaceae bacterium]